MSFVLFSDQLERKFDLTLEKMSNGPEAVSPGLRGNTWMDVLVPSYAQKSVPFGIIGVPYSKPSELVKVYKSRRTKVRDASAVRGAVVHACVLRCLEHTRRYLMRCRAPNKIDIIRKLRGIRKIVWQSAMKEIPTSSPVIGTKDKRKIKLLASRVLDFECILLSSRITFMISRNPAITRDVLIESVPFQIEPTLSVADMGFSGHPTPDLVWPGKRAVGEIKTGRESKSHVIDLAGYALALERQYGNPVDIGFILYLDVDRSQKVPTYNCVVYSLSDLYRRLFIQKRNEALKILYRYLPQRGS